MDVQGRVRRLERSHRMLRGALGALFALNAWMLLTGLGGAEVADVVRARRFELVGGEAANELLADIKRGGL